MSRLRTLLLNTILLSVTLVVMLGITEGLVRLLAPQPTGLSHQDRFGLALHYPRITRYLPQYGHEVTFNRAGMRDREHAIDKPADVFRIMVMGDSFMEGLQVPFDSLMPVHLEHALAQATGRKIEVMNLGVSGWGTDDELRYLTEYGLQYHPDLVLIVMTLHNDIGDNLRQQWHTVRNDTLVSQAVAPMTTWQFFKVQLKAFVATRSQTYQLWRRFRHRGEIQQISRNLNTHVMQLFRTPDSDPIAKGMSLTEHLLGAIRDTVAATGGQVAVVLLPLKYQMTDSTFAQLVREANVPATEMEPDRPQQKLTAIGRRLALPVIDLLPNFRAWSADSTAPLYLEWDGHWNSAGHALAAAATARGLLAGPVFRPPVAVDSIASP